MIRALVLTSTSNRHCYFASKIAEIFDVVGVLTEPKKNYFTKPRQESSLVARHFENLAAAERDFFGVTESVEVGFRVVDDLNSPEAVAYAKSLSPDVVCLFGTSILKEGWLRAFPDRIINLHLGLSPFYRGSATLFWPFYFDELECLGTTIHLAVERVDAGDILRRIKARLLPGDTYYTATTRLIRDSIDAFPLVVKSYLDGTCNPFQQERVVGRLMKKSDFNEAALRQALDFVGAGLGADEIYRIAESSKCLCSR